MANRRRRAAVEGNPIIEQPACFGKRRHETESEAQRMPGRPYHCAWCNGWHVTTKAPPKLSMGKSARKGKGLRTAQISW